MGEGTKAPKTVKKVLHSKATPFSLKLFFRKISIARFLQQQDIRMEKSEINFLRQDSDLPQLLEIANTTHFHTKSNLVLSKTVGRTQSIDISSGNFTFLGDWYFKKITSSIFLTVKPVRPKVSQNCTFSTFFLINVIILFRISWLDCFHQSLK